MRPREALQALPLTSYPGSEFSSSFSPDGNQVAFCWDGENQDNLDIYVKMIGSETPLRLTTEPALDFSPAWSADGRTIAFLRRLPGGGPHPAILAVSVLPPWPSLRNALRKQGSGAKESPGGEPFYLKVGSIHVVELLIE